VLPRAPTADKGDDGPPAFTLLCIDDNLLLVDALERRLTLEPDFAAFYRVDDFASSAAVVVAHHPSLVLLDIDLPGGTDAMLLLEDIVRLAPESRVIVFTGYPQGSLISQAMSRGAWGFVSKGVPSDRLIDAIHRVRAGEAVIELDD
jgi:two-component system, NarL family, response regulator FusR